MKKDKVFVICAGEASGDILGAGLMAELNAKYPEAKFFGIGGDCMKKRGLVSIYDIKDISYMGLVEVLIHIPKILCIKSFFIRKIKKLDPVCFIGIDSPDFNLRVSSALKKHNIKVVHYVSPSIWAWRPNRILSIGRSISLMLSIFPFEKKLYDKANIPCVYVGHHLANSLSFMSTKKALDKLGMKKDFCYVGVLPGSRKSEIERHLLIFLNSLTLVQDSIKNIIALIPVASSSLLPSVKKIINENSFTFPIKIVVDGSEAVITASKYIIATSGTVALEAMFLKRKMIVCYRMNFLSYFILKRLVYSKYIALPNILLNRKVVPELIQDECNPKNIAKNLLIQHNDDFEEVFKLYDIVISELNQNSDVKAANAVSELIRG